MPSAPIEQRRGWLRWLVAIVICVLVAIVAEPLFFPVVPQMRARANCFHNLKTLCLAVAMYADANGGRCPMDSTNPTLVGSMRLLSNVLGTAKVLYCPSDKRPGARAEWDFKKLTTLNISYSYVPNLKWQDTPDSPLFLDRIYTTSKGSLWPTNGNHGDKGGNVGFNDGHAQWCNNLPYGLKQADGKEIVLSP